MGFPERKSYTSEWRLNFKGLDFYRFLCGFADSDGCWRFRGGEFEGLGLVSSSCYLLSQIRDRLEEDKVLQGNPYPRSKGNVYQINLGKRTALKIIPLMYQGYSMECKLNVVKCLV